MAVELSSNWKKLQAQIKAESSTTKTSITKASATQSLVRKTETKSIAGKKRQRSSEEDGAPRTQPPGKKLKAGKPGTTTKGPAAKRTTKMGVTQSSQLSGEVAYNNNGKGQSLPKGITPSLALWAEDHDISAEDMAQAYGLGASARPGRGATSVAMVTTSDGDRENAGLTPGLAVGKYVALDCEMVGVGPGGHDDALARVSVVDFFGRQVYDSYVLPQPGQRVVDWRTHVSGVSPRHLKVARPFDEVRAVVEQLLRGDGEGSGPRILVGHDVRHDLRVLDLAHPPRLIRDTAKFAGFKQYGHGPKPALRVVARAVLGVEIQQGAHSSVEDARVTMQLFRQHKPAFDVECANKFGTEPTAGASKPATKKKPQKNKKKH